MFPSNFSRNSVFSIFLVLIVSFMLACLKVQNVHSRKATKQNEAIAQYIKGRYEHDEVMEESQPQDYYYDKVPIRRIQLQPQPLNYYDLMASYGHRYPSYQHYMPHNNDAFGLVGALGFGSILGAFLIYLSRARNGTGKSLDEDFSIFREQNKENIHFDQIFKKIKDFSSFSSFSNKNNPTTKITSLPFINN